MSDVKRSQAGAEAEVFMKLSIDNLKEMLLQAGLLYEIKGSPIVLPMISVTDRVNSKSFVWWSDSYSIEQMQLKEWLENFQRRLKVVLSKQNFLTKKKLKIGFQMFDKVKIKIL